MPDQTPTPAVVSTPSAPALVPAAAPKKPTCAEILATVDDKVLAALEATLLAAQQTFDAEHPPNTTGAYAKSRAARELGIAHGGIVAAIQSLDAFKTVSKGASK